MFEGSILTIPFILLYFIHKTRRLNRHRGKRKCVSQEVKANIFASLKDDLTKSGCTPHYMIELSKREIFTMKNNIITASGMRRDDKGILSYTTLHHGSNVDLKGNFHYKVISVQHFSNSQTIFADMCKEE